jgi:uncharacterized protein
MSTSRDATFEWDPEKARSNERKHGVSFQEAATVFRDPYALHAYDGAHSWEEERFIIIGMSAREHLLTVVYVERVEMTFRIISARERLHAREETMKKKAADDDPLDREIDFSNARRNPHFLSVVGPKYVRVLDEDLADLFPDNESVNAALRSLAGAKPQKVSARRVAAPRKKTRA